MREHPAHTPRPGTQSRGVLYAHTGKGEQGGTIGGIKEEKSKVYYIYVISIPIQGNAVY